MNIIEENFKFIEKYTGTKEVMKENVNTKYDYDNKTLNDYGFELLCENDNSVTIDDAGMVPIYILSKYGSMSYKKNDDTYKNVSEITSVAFGKFIKMMSGDVFSHQLLSLDTNFSECYTYSSLIPGKKGGGFLIEDVVNSQLYKDINKLQVNVVFVTRQGYNKITEYIDYLKGCQNDTKYHFKHLFSPLSLVKSKQDNRKHVCSTFIAECLFIADHRNVNKTITRIRPNDIMTLPRSFFVASYKTGMDLDIATNEIKEITKNIWDTNKDMLLPHMNDVKKILIESSDQIKPYDVRWHSSYDNNSHVLIENNSLDILIKVSLCNNRVAIFESNDSYNMDDYCVTILDFLEYVGTSIPLDIANKYYHD